MNRLYRFLLRVYPRWFRDRYEAELIEAFAADHRRPQYAGRMGVIRFWASIVADLFVSAHRARRNAPRPSVSTHPKSSIMDALLQDLRHASRQLLRRPGFTAVAVLSLALGIGGNAVIIAFFDGFVFNPFPHPEPGRIVAIGSTFPLVSDEEAFVEAISAPEFLDVRSARTIQSIAAFDLANRNVSGGDRPERVFTALAVTDLFGPFGLPPVLGRGFTADELVPFGPSVAIISYRLWQGRFGGDPSIVSKTVRVNGVPFTVVRMRPAPSAWRTAISRCRDDDRASSRFERLAQTIRHGEPAVWIPSKRSETSEWASWAGPILKVSWIEYGCVRSKRCS